MLRIEFEWARNNTASISNPVVGASVHTSDVEWNVLRCDIRKIDFYVLERFSCGTGNSIQSVLGPLLVL